MALERQKEEYERKIKTLEFQVNIALSEARGALGWTPRELRLAKLCWDKWKRYQFTSLRDAIWGHAVLIKGKVTAKKTIYLKNAYNQFLLN